MDPFASCDKLYPTQYSQKQKHKKRSESYRQGNKLLGLEKRNIARNCKLHRGFILEIMGTQFGTMRLRIYPTSNTPIKGAIWNAESSLLAGSR